MNKQDRLNQLVRDKEKLDGIIANLKSEIEVENYCKRNNCCLKIGNRVSYTFEISKETIYGIIKQIRDNNTVGDFWVEFDDGYKTWCHGCELTKITQSEISDFCVGNKVKPIKDSKGIRKDRIYTISRIEYNRNDCKAANRIYFLETNQMVWESDIVLHCSNNCCMCCKCCCKYN